MLTKIILIFFTFIFGTISLFAGGVGPNIKHWQNLQKIQSIPQGEQYIQIIDTHLQGLSNEELDALQSRIYAALPQNVAPHGSPKENSFTKILRYISSKIYFVRSGETYIPPSIQSNSYVRIHIIEIGEDGTELQNTYKTEKPLGFTLGSGSISNSPIAVGFETSILGMQIGEIKTFTFSPEQAYGYYDPDNTFTIQKSESDSDYIAFAGGVGTMFPLGFGGEAKILENTDEIIVLDMNHPQTGKTVTITAQVLSISGLTE